MFRVFWMTRCAKKLSWLTVLLFAVTLTSCGRNQESESGAIELSELVRPISSRDGEGGSEQGYSPDSEPGTAAGHAGTDAGHPGTATGHAGTDAGHPGTATGHAGTDAAHPGTATGHPGTGAGHPGTATGHAGTDAAQPEEAAAAQPQGTEAAKTEELKKLFGERCIPEQTFEVTLSEYDGKVWFVSCAPTADDPNIRFRIIQDGEVLAEEEVYVPDDLEKMEFTSLDAVSFFDINFDGNTDIVLIGTYGKTSFASVYYGYESSRDSGPYFYPQWGLSDNLSNQVKPLTISGIRKLLPAGPKDGIFSDYREAYRVMGSLYELKHRESGITYDLIYFDGDDIPELAAGKKGYYLTLYTFQDGKVYTLMDDEPYGISGNPGYEYVPKRNSMRFYSTEYAGAIVYITYMSMNSLNELETDVQIKYYNFNDANSNGALDENEMDSLGNFSAYYVDGKEISEEEALSYDKGEYEYRKGRMSLAELLEKCGE